jgi:hypothetical protein
MQVLMILIFTNTQQKTELVRDLLTLRSRTGGRLYYNHPENDRKVNDNGLVFII